MDMTNLQSLSVFLTERLTLAAQEIFKAVEVTVTEYHDEISRSRQENELLKTRLLEAGIEFYSELQPSVSALHEGGASVGQQPRAEQWGEEGADIQVKLELSATKDEPAASQAKEPSSPNPWQENDARVEEAFHTLMTESDVSTLLHAAPFAQDVKEEPEESGSDLRTAVTGESQACTAASNHACGFEDDMESHRLSSVHKALRSKLPLTSRPRVTLHKRCINYDPVGQDKELAQRRERYRMKRARGKSKLLKAGRERKTEPRLEQTACRRRKGSLPDVMLLDEDQSPPSRSQLSPGHLTEEVSENGQELSGAFRGGPAEDDGLAGANLCVVCGRTFTSRGLLKIHLRVHSGEKPYHCHFCDKNFRQSSHLNVHVRIHTGEKPYSCPTCGKRFSDRSARNRHLKVHLESAEDCSHS